MSTALFFLVPIGLAAVVWSLCFVGVCFQTSGEAGPPYSDDIVGGSDASSLVGYWPLNDLIGPPLTMTGPPGGARDLSGNNRPGTYTIPPDYPTMPANSEPISKGTVGRGGTIVPGDSGSTTNPLAASADFEGGYVSIPWPANAPSFTDFTLEAWVQPTWSTSGNQFTRAVFGGVTEKTGFALSIDPNNEWQITIGTGGGLTNISTGVSATNPDGSFSSTYVAVRWNSSISELTLWINPDSETPGSPTPAWPNASSPSPPGLTYAPVAPSATNLVSFFIGAGAPQLTLRTLNGTPGTAPLFPFRGLIQSVAVYSSALDATDLQNHFAEGGS